MCDIRLFRSALMDYETTAMISDNGASLIITDWIDDHSEMLGEWEAQTRYDMDFLVEKRKLDTAVREVQNFLSVNGIQNELRRELCDSAKKEKLLNCLPKNKRRCSAFELNCYYIMFQKKL